MSAVGGSPVGPPHTHTEQGCDDHRSARKHECRDDVAHGLASTRWHDAHGVKTTEDGQNC